VDIYIPIISTPEEGYMPFGDNFPQRKNIHEVPIQNAHTIAFDCIIFQSKKNYLYDQYEILSPKQQLLPKIYLEHDPPREHPTDTKHIIDDENMLLVHVSHFNKLMWDSNRTPTTVIEHGVVVPLDAAYSGEKLKGIVMVNNIKKRGRRLGLDIFLKMREYVPLDIIGMGSEEVEGLGEIPYKDLPYFLSQYRFFFNPIRYTSLGLSVIEAMMIGLPIVGLATTELSTVIENDISGYINTDPYQLITHMQSLLLHKDKAYELGVAAKKKAVTRFSINRFINNWMHTLRQVISTRKGKIPPQQFIGGSLS
jgi:glycosyltransferase involved in cell wall biosynthesis